MDVIKSRMQIQGGSATETALKVLRTEGELFACVLRLHSDHICRLYRILSRSDANAHRRNYCKRLPVYRLRVLEKIHVEFSSNIKICHTQKSVLKLTARVHTQNANFHLLKTTIFSFCRRVALLKIRRSHFGMFACTRRWPLPSRRLLTMRRQPQLPKNYESRKAAPLRSLSLMNADCWYACARASTHAIS